MDRLIQNHKDGKVDTAGGLQDIAPNKIDEAEGLKYYVIAKVADSSKKDDFDGDFLNGTIYPLLDNVLRSTNIFLKNNDFAIHGDSTLSFPKLTTNTATNDQMTTVIPLPITKVDAMKEINRISKDRFDTPLIRNVLFLSNLYRVIRFKLDSEVKWYNPNDFVKSYSALSDKLTEEYGNNVTN